MTRVPRRVGKRARDPPRFALLRLPGTRVRIADCGNRNCECGDGTEKRAKSVAVVKQIIRRRVGYIYSCSSLLGHRAGGRGGRRREKRHRELRRDRRGYGGVNETSGGQKKKRREKKAEYKIEEPESWSFRR